MSDTDARLHRIDRATLTGVVRRALGSDVAEVVDWRAGPLVYADVNPASGGLHRFEGTARDRGHLGPWSAVLKVARTLSEEHDPTHFLYSRREALAYRSGLLEDLADGLAVPRCYGDAEQPDGTVWLWLEDVADCYSGNWPLARYGLAARHLGRLGGAYLTGRPLPSHPWLTQRTASLRRWVVWLADFTQALELIQRAETWDRPFVRRAFPVPVADRLRRLWDERELFLEMLARLPPVLCHRDADRANLLARRSDGRDETVLIDWAFVGTGAVSEEIAVLVYGTLLRLAVPMADAVTLEELVLDGYLTGLRDVGWRGDPLTVHCGYAAAAALRGGFVATGLRFTTLDDRGLAAEESRWGRPIGEIMEQRAALTYFLLDRADEARRLAAHLRGRTSW